MNIEDINLEHFLGFDYLIFGVIITLCFLFFKIASTYITNKADTSRSKSIKKQIEDDINNFEFKRLRMEDKIRDLRLEGRDLTLDVDKISKMLDQLESQRNLIVTENNNLIKKYAIEIERIKKDFKEDSIQQLNVNKKLKKQYEILIMKKIEAKKERLIVIKGNESIIRAGSKARKTIDLINQRQLELKNKDDLSNIKSIKSSYNYYQSDNIDPRINEIMQYQISLVNNGEAFKISDYEIVNETEIEKNRRLSLMRVNALKMINYEFGVILNNASKRNIDELIELTNNLFKRVELDLSYSPTAYLKINDIFKQSKIDELNIMQEINIDIDDINNF